MLLKKTDNVKKQLDEQLEEIKFTKQQEVIREIRRLTWKEKLASIWNKEIEIPLLPVGGVCMLLFLTFGTKLFSSDINNPSNERVIVEIGGNFYWKDEFERVVINDEN